MPSVPPGESVVANELMIVADASDAAATVSVQLPMGVPSGGGKGVGELDDCQSAPGGATEAGVVIPFQIVFTFKPYVRWCGLSKHD